MYTPELPSRQELTERIARQALIPQRILTWAKDNQDRLDTSDDCSRAVQDAKQMMIDLSELAHSWVNDALSKQDLLEKLPEYERRRSKLNDLMQKIER